MRIKNLAIPMRAQPFHFGHQKLLTRVSGLCERGAIFLNTEQDTLRNPFPFRLRKSWIDAFLQARGINNLLVTERDLDLRPEEKHREYRSQFGEDDFYVLTTNETEGLFKSLGFQTINHCDSTIIKTFWPEESNPNFLHGYGQIIRKLLTKRGNCFGLLDPMVEREAREYLLKLLG